MSKGKNAQKSIRESAQAGASEGVQRGVAKLLETVVVGASLASIYWAKEHRQEIGHGLRHFTVATGNRIKSRAGKVKRRLQAAKHMRNEEQE